MYPGSNESGETFSISRSGRLLLEELEELEEPGELELLEDELDE